MSRLRTRPPHRHSHRAHTLAIAAWLSLGLRPLAQAQVIADPTAPANQRATVLQDSTGRPLVNIQTPSAAGVSRNTYSQFDVQAKGIVLNNSRTANPWLAGGEARIILNEVRSSSPSLLNGAINVNGSRAAVVIANPSGIQVDGASFVNTSRATLTTGTPVLNSDTGALTALDVRQGTVSIGAQGLNNTGVSYTDILSRAAVITGQVQAGATGELNVITGAQTMTLANRQLTDGTATATGPKPTVAIDTAALGGMYAGKITLLATEAGTGVRNAGTLQADAAQGQLIITAEGRLENTGQLDAALTSAATLNGAIDHSGTMTGRSALLVRAGSDLNLGAGAKLIGGNAGEIGNIGQIGISTGRHLNLAAGSLIEASGPVTLQTAGQLNANGAVLRSTAGDLQALSAQGIALNNSTATGQRVHLETGAPFQTINGASSAPITITGGDTRGAAQTTLLASGDITLSKPGAVVLSSSAGHVNLQAGRHLTVSAGTQITAAQDLTAAAQETLTLQGLAATVINGVTTTPQAIAKLSASGHLRLSAADVLLQASSIEAGGSLAIEATQGNANLSLPRLRGTPAHQGTQLKAGQNLSISAYQGDIKAEDLYATGQHIDILSKVATWLTHSAAPAGQAGSLAPVRGIAARGDLTIGSLADTGSIWLSGSASAAGQTKVIAQGQVMLSPAAVPMRLSGSNLTVQGASLDISGADLQATAGHLALSATDEPLRINSYATTSSLSPNTTAPATKLQATGNIALQASKDVLLSNTSASAGANLGLTSAAATIKANTLTLAAKGMLSLSSLGAQSHAGGQYTGGALSLFNQGGALSLLDTRLQTTLIDAASAPALPPALLTSLLPLSGQLSVESGGSMAVDHRTAFLPATDLSIVTGQGDINIKPTPLVMPTGSLPNSLIGLILSNHQLGIKRDLTLATRNGRLLTFGWSSIDGSGPVQKVTLGSTRDITLVGSSVQLQGSALNGAQITIAATEGDVALESFKLNLNATGNHAWAPTAIGGPWTNPAVPQAGPGLRAIDIRAAGNIRLDAATLATQGQIRISSGGNLIANGRFLQDTNTRDGVFTENHLLQGTYLVGNQGVDLAALGGHLILSGTQASAVQGPVRLQALGDVALEATAEHTLLAQNTTTIDRSWYGKKKVITTAIHNEALVSEPVWLNGTDIDIKAGQALNTYGTQFSASGKLRIQAGGDANYYATYDQISNTVNTHTTSSLWGIKYNRAEGTDSRAVLSGKPAVLQSQGSIQSYSGGDQLLQGTIATYGGTASFEVGVGDSPKADARIRLEGLKNIVQEARTRQSNYVLWQKMTGSGSTVETLVLPQFNGPTAPIFKGPVLADIPAGHFQTQVKTLITQPGMGYLGELATRTDVNWQPVKLAFDQWSYKHEGLTPAGAALIGVAVAWATGGMGVDLLGTTAPTAGGGSITTLGGSTLAVNGAATTLGAIVNAGFTALSTQAAITLVNNKGDVGQTLKQLGSSEAVKATLASMLTAGVLDKLGGIPEIKALNATNAVFADKLTFNLINASGRALSYTAVNGGSLEDALQGALIGAVVDTAHGSLAGEIKALESSYVVHKLAHALAGCLAGAAASGAGGTCQDGALGAATGEMVADLFKHQKPSAYAPQAEWDAFDAKVLGYSKIVAGAVAAYSGGDAQAAITTAETAVRHNFLTFDENQLRKQAAQACKTTGDAQACADQKRWEAMDLARDAKVAQTCATSPSSQACRDWRDLAVLARTSYEGKPGTRSWALDEMSQGGFSDAAELHSIQKLINTTPYNYLKASPHLQSLLSIVADVTPLVGDAKAFYEAADPFDYAIAMVGVLGPAGDAASTALKAAKAAHQAGNATEVAAQLQKAEKLIAENAGKTGNWSTGVNGALEPKATYKLNNGHLYKTDNIGRVNEVQADLAKTVMDRNKYQQCVVGKCGELGDQGGHLIAATLGGAGDRINLVPQAATLNNGPWKAMENEFKVALDAGKNVTMKIELGYPSGDGIRPNLFRVTATIDGVTQAPRIFNQ